MTCSKTVTDPLRMAHECPPIVIKAAGYLAHSCYVYVTISVAVTIVAAMGAVLHMVQVIVTYRTRAGVVRAVKTVISWVTSAKSV